MTLSLHDAMQLYNGCLVEVEGRIGFVREINPGEPFPKLSIKFVGKRNLEVIDANPEVVLCPTEPYRLGYVQSADHNATYLSRAPRRQYAVGWNEGNVNGFNTTRLAGMGTRLEENLKGQFMSYEDALKVLVKIKLEDARVAFDRMFAVEKRDGYAQPILCYKGLSLCLINDNGPEFSKDQKAAKFLFEQIVKV